MDAKRFNQGSNVPESVDNRAKFTFGAGTRNALADGLSRNVAGTTYATQLLPRLCELACVEIGGNRSGAAGRIRQGHIAVRSYQINGIAPQAGSTHLRTPWKDVQRQFSPITHGPDLGRGVAIHVDLPVHRSERREVVGIH